MKSISENISLSVLDIFSVMMPGIIAELLLWQVPAVQAGILSLLSFFNADWQWAVSVFIGAYISGHVLFFIGSFLDDLVYDPLKDRFWNTKRLVQEVTEIKKKELGYDDPHLLNNYKWCRVQFLIKYPAVYTLIESHEASSKFFRSLTIVMIAGVGIFLSLQQNAVSLISLILAVIALLMYMRLRHKAVKTTYEHILVICGNKPILPNQKVNMVDSGEKPVNQPMFQ